MISFKRALLPLTVLLSSANAAQADDEWLFIPAVAYQQKELSFDQEYSGADSNKADFSVSLPVLSFGLTAAYKKFFISVKHESNISDTPTNTNETDRSQSLQFNLTAVDGSQINVAREDISLTVGYNVWRSLNLFVGYLDGQTDVTPAPFCADPGQNDGLICTRVNRAFQQFFLGDNGFVDNQAPYVQSYSENGFYAGASYGFQISENNTLSLSFAYAAMDGEYKDNAYDPDNAFQDENGVPSFVAFNYAGDSTGTSLGITWTGSLGDNSSYFFDIRNQNYSMDGEDATGLANYEGISLSTDETMLGIGAGINLYF